MFGVVSRLVRPIVLLMEFSVLRARHAQKVGDAVVGAIVIQVMNDPPLWHGAAPSLPNKDMLGTVAAIYTDKYVASTVQGSTTLPTRRVFSKPTGGMTREIAHGKTNVLIAPERRGLSDSRFGATATAAVPIRRNPLIGRLAPRVLFHSAEGPRARPVALYELLGSGRVRRAGDKCGSAATSAGASFHFWMVAP